MSARPSPTLLLAMLVALVPVAGGAVAADATAAGPPEPPAAGAPASAPAPGAALGSPPASATAPASAPAPTNDSSAQDDADTTIDGTVTLSLTPERPGSVRAAVEWRLPSSVSAFEVEVPEDATVRDATALERTGPRRFEWTGDDRTPSLTVDVAANDSGDGRRAAGLDRWSGLDRRTASHGEYVFADPGPWALVRVPQFGTRWRFTGADVDLRTDVVVAGAGATGGEMAYLGPVTEHVTTAAGQRVRLVVPDRVDLAEEPDDVLASLADASRRLDAGPRDDEVVVIAAPADDRWAVRGLQFGPDDAWVLADSRLDDVENVWIHEYVHTRQDVDLAPSARWVGEGSAEYYAALFSLRQGHVDFRTFRDHLANGGASRYADDVLADPSTWSSSTPYAKGALAFGAVDYRMRAATDAEARADDVLRRLNAQEGPVDGEDVVAAVRAAAGDGPAAAARRYATTTDAPRVWSASEHRETFVDVGALFTYRRADDGLAVSGPYRNRTVAGPLVVGETLTSAVVVANRGSEPGTFAATYRAGEVSRTETGRLAPGETATVTFARAFDAPGTYEVVAGEVRETVRVAAPATPTVTALRVDPATVAPGEPTTVTATVVAADERPAGGTVTVVVGDRTVATPEVRLDAGERRTVAVEATVDEPGTYRVVVGDRTASLAVASEGGSGADDPTRTDGAPLAGVGPALAALLLASVAAGLLARRR